MTIQNEVKAVKRIIEQADKTKAYLVFLNRHVEVNHVSDISDDGDVWIGLAEDAQGQSGGPYFEILSITPGGTILIHGEEYLAGLDDEGLAEAITNAHGEREQFYTERAEQFGSSAYPR